MFARVRVARRLSLDARFGEPFPRVRIKQEPGFAGRRGDSLLGCRECRCVQFDAAVRFNGR
eukprot:10268147-Alexandrium_andersonii.AAC.1